MFKLRLHYNLGYFSSNSILNLNSFILIKTLMSRLLKPISDTCLCDVGMLSHISLLRYSLSINVEVNTWGHMAILFGFSLALPFIFSFVISALDNTVTCHYI